MTDQPVYEPDYEVFHLGDLLSVTDGKMVSPRYVDGVYAVMDFVTGEKHMTHQLSRAADVVKPWLLEQHPWLAGITVPDGLNSKEAVLDWLDDVTSIYGVDHIVMAMPLGMYVGREPIAELRELAPQAQIIGIDMGDQS